MQQHIFGFTQSEWMPPENLPDLSDAKVIAFDLETYDPQLKTTGPGWTTKNGHIIGIAVAVDGWKGYYPIRHENGFNWDRKRVLSWFKNLMKSDAIKVAHNAIYDLGWLYAEGINVKGPIVDTMIMAPIINENKFSYALNAVGKDMLNAYKNETLLKQASAEFGVNPKNEMYKLPAIFVGSYAEQDADLTLRLYQHMKPIMEKESLLSVYKLEMDLIPIIFEMTKKGVRVDVEKARRYKKSFKNTEKKILSEILADTGIPVDVWTATSVAKVFDKLKITYPRTEKTDAPSFTKDFLLHHSHPVAQKIQRARELNKVQSTFIDTILKHEASGRIHANIHQMRDGESGTVSGRFSYSNPNLQQLPSRNKEIKKQIRGLFLPEEGEVWGSFDYSQQEPRIASHFAYRLGCEGSQSVVEEYQKNADADFHSIVAKIANIERDQAKTINLGLFYGMGVNKLSNELQVEVSVAKEILYEYNLKVPFVKELTKRVSNYANSEGYVSTIKGRKCRFELWEPTTFGVFKALPKDQAELKYGEHHLLQRAGTYKALNRLIQGSAADQTKQAMVELYKENLIPLIQIHDELTLSFDGSNETKNKIIDIMENAIKLSVPNKVDCDMGKSWGDAT
jgi:DNA polymerase I-like protein with 3'-5' exonuclease and polymerase domains